MMHIPTPTTHPAARRSRRTWVHRLAAVGAVLGSFGPAGSASAHAASDRAATVITGGGTVSIPVVHPCTGASTFIHFTGLRVVLRNAGDGGGGAHELLSITGDFSIDGVDGRFHETYVVNHVGGDSLVTDVQIYSGAGSDGTRMVVTVLFHTRLVDGEPVVEVDDFRAHCLGFS
jgi:hypothetical protein